MKTYPLASPYSVMDHPLTRSAPEAKVRAVRTDEFRPPRAGEWYLSGAIPAAYRAPNDLTTPFRILRLVAVREVTVEVISPLPEAARG